MYFYKWAKWIMALILVVVFVCFTFFLFASKNKEDKVSIYYTSNTYGNLVPCPT